MHYKFSLLISLTLLFTVSAHAKMYKCTSAGKTVYTDKPCASQQEREAGEIDTTRLRATDRATRHVITSSKGTSIGNGVDFGKTSLSRFTTAKAIIESLAIDGRDCEWDIKVKDSYDKCRTFAKRMQRDWAATMDTLKDLIKDTEFFNQKRVEFKAVQRKVEDVTGYLEFVHVRLEQTGQLR